MVSIACLRTVLINAKNHNYIYSAHQAHQNVLYVCAVHIILNHVTSEHSVRLEIKIKLYQA